MRQSRFTVEETGSLGSLMFMVLSTLAALNQIFHLAAVLHIGRSDDTVRSNLGVPAFFEAE